jgi:hypothetical protein
MSKKKKSSINGEIALVPPFHLACNLVNGWLQILFAKTLVREWETKIGAREGLDGALQGAGKGGNINGLAVNWDDGTLAVVCVQP